MPSFDREARDGSTDVWTLMRRLYIGRHWEKREVHKH